MQKSRRDVLKGSAGTTLLTGLAGCSASDRIPPSLNPLGDAPAIKFRFDGFAGQRYEITHTGGDTVDATRVRVQYTEVDSGEQKYIKWNLFGKVNSELDISPDKTLTTPTGVEGGTKIRVIWVPQNGDDNRTIGVYEVQKLD
ncbi:MULTISPECIES: twin-arginine translocation signal domain-containing protein [unclassified Halorubrum]|uniref:twin-arginine translocation signal domain-containing protein n=1 Tax=unclassified Halorubrum TaxID=2642239 RepID=UPI0003DBCDA8|nr:MULTISPECIES: twin-arginine translocation signal domain-containing protein [unclassified Halorubrum]CDK39619.1 putative lipoprotein [Halorubrum sp. AJ67]